MKKPIFVVGSGRCGTTILDRSLGKHPDLVSFPFEPQLFSLSNLSEGLYQLLSHTATNISIEKIKAYLLKRYSFKPAREEKTLGFCQWHSRLNYEQLIEQFLFNYEENPKNASDYCRNFLDGVYGPYVASQKANNWIDGSPVNGRLIPQIVSVYPEAFFVHIIRDGRDVAKSFTRLGWSQGSFEVAAQFWACQVRTTRQLGNLFTPDRYIEVKFEDLVKSPKDIMVKLSIFLQLEYNPEMVSLINEKRACRYVSSHSSWESEYVRAIASDLVEYYKWEF